jgi:hypothetical protein
MEEQIEAHLELTIRAKEIDFIGHDKHEQVILTRCEHSPETQGFNSIITQK